MEMRNQNFNEPIDIPSGVYAGMRPPSAFGVMAGFGETEKKFYDDIDSMIKLRVKSKMFADVNVVLADVAKMNKVYSILGRYAKRIKNLSVKEFYRDYKKGMKQINKKIPVFIELPTYEKKGDGYVKKDGKSNDITIHPPLTSSAPDTKIGYEDTKSLSFSQDGDTVTTD